MFSDNKSATIVKFHVDELTFDMLEYVAPLFKLYLADPEIVLSKVAVTTMLCPGPIISSESESVRITKGEQAEPQRG